MIKVNTQYQKNATISSRVILHAVTDAENTNVKTFAIQRIKHL